MRSTACMVACAPPQACFVLAAQARKLSLSWVGGGSPKTPRTEQRRRCSYHRSLELLYPLCFRSLRLLVVAPGRSSWWQNWACDRYVFFLAPPPGYAVLRSVSSREHGCCPGRHLLRFTIYRLVGGCRIMATPLRIASGTLAQ